MVLIGECDDTGKMVSLTNSEERNLLRRDCLKHATRPSGCIDWEAFEIGF